MKFSCLAKISADSRCVPRSYAIGVSIHSLDVGRNRVLAVRYWWQANFNAAPPLEGKVSANEVTKRGTFRSSHAVGYLTLKAPDKMTCSIPITVPLPPEHMTTSMTLPDGSLRYAAVTDVGLRRPVNQDSYATHPCETWPYRGHLFVVADGMGAHAAGELASQQAVEQVLQAYQEVEGEESAVLGQALHDANLAIHRRGQSDPQLYNMGTTCSVLTLKPEGAFVGHVGDSRVYRCRGETIEQLTFDHSLFWEMREAKQFSKDEERRSAVPRNVITRCLGPHADVQVDLEGPFSIKAGDRFILCSDGLTGRVSDAEVGAISSSLNAEDAAQFLVDLANLRGGSDNITVVVLEVLSDQLATSGPTVERPKRAAESSTHPAWWLTMGLGILLAVLSLGVQQWILAGCAIAAALLAGLGAVYQRLTRPMHVEGGTRQPPYATASTTLGPAVVASFAESMNEVIGGISLPPQEFASYRDQIQQLVYTDSPDRSGVARQAARLTSDLSQAFRDAVHSS